jgi:uncharacterized Zn-finger protein
MPVLSTPHHTIANLPGVTTTSTYVFLGAILILCIGIIISRKSPAQTSITIVEPEKEKDRSSDPESPSAPIENKPRIQQQLQPPPFTLPLPLSQNSDLDLSCFEPTPASEFPPRRRGYTTNTGTEVSGEIIVAEGWRRHTRVFGGGVCKACEESETSQKLLTSHKRSGYVT